MNLPDIIQFTAVQHTPLYTSSEDPAVYLPILLSMYLWVILSLGQL